MDEQEGAQFSTITVDSKKEPFSAKTLLRWVPLVLIIIVAYLGSAFVYKIFPFGSSKTLLSKTIDNITKKGASEEKVESEITINKAISPSGVNLFEIAGTGEKLALSLPDSYAANSKLGNLIKGIDTNKITTVVNIGYDSAKVNETWRKKLILLQDYGENKAASLSLARSQVMDSLKANDGGATVDYKTVSVSGLVGLKRTHEEKVSDPYLVTEYYIFTKKNIYGVSEYSWRKASETTYATDEIDSIITTLEVR